MNAIFMIVAAILLLGPLIAIHEFETIIGWRVNLASRFWCIQLALAQPC